MLDPGSWILNVGGPILNTEYPRKLSGLNTRFGRVEEGFDLEQPQAGTVHLERGEVDAEFGVGDQDINAGVGQDEFNLVGLEEIIDGNDDCASVQYSEQCRDEFRTILQPEANAIAGFNLEFLPQFA